MYPTQDTTHAAEGLALRTDHYKNAVVMGGILKSFLNRVQDLENSIWQVVNAFLLVNSPTGDQLNALGILVGQARLGLSDAQYLWAIRLRIRANRSQGRAEDLISLAVLMLAGLGVTPQYLDMYPMQFIMEVPRVPVPAVSIPFFNIARSGATRGMVHYTDLAYNRYLQLSSRRTASAGNGVLGSRRGGVTGGLMCAAQEV